MDKNPAGIESLIHLMGRGLYIGRRVSPFFTRLRYFDFERRRAGVPEDVAVMVETITDTGTTLAVVNGNPLHSRDLVVQGGGYAEHSIEWVELDGMRTRVEAPAFRFKIAPGAGARLEIAMRRHVNQPTLRFPWDR